MTPKQPWRGGASRPRPPRLALALAWSLLGLVPQVAAGASFSPAAASPEWAARGMVAQSDDTSGDVAGSWTLVDTWSERPASIEPGQLSQVSDLDASPTGTIYLLDGSQGLVHVFDPRGRPRRTLSILAPDEADWTPQRLAVGPDGGLFLLAARLGSESGGYLSRVDRFAPDGRRLGQFRLRSTRPQPYRDLTVDAQGNVLLTRVHAAALDDRGANLAGLAETAVERRDPSGRLLIERSPPALGQAGSITRGPDGRVYVVNRVQPNLNLPGGEDPRPSSQTPPAEPVEGILIFDAALDLESFEPFNAADDLAAGVAGVFVSRDVEVFALGASEPLYSGPVGNPSAGAGDRLQLAALPDGRLALGLRHCALQGLLLIEHPERGPAEAQLVAGSGAATRGGPDYPIALAADREVALLQGRFDREGAGPEAGLRASPQGSVPQTLQRWVGDRPVLQHGLCSGSGAWRSIDLAMDEDRVYSLDAVTIRRFDETGPLPVWTKVPLPPDDRGPAPQLVALDADAGRVAALDAARAEVLLLDARGEALARWPAGTAGEPAGSVLPVDIALDGERLLLADRGRKRILVLGLDGSLAASWPLLAPPVRIASGPESQTFVLAADAWVYAYDRAGEPVAAWPLPDAGSDAGASPESYDIAVDAAGRVLVSFAQLDFDTAAPPWSLRMPSHPLRAAGVWVFARRSDGVSSALAARQPAGCLLRAWSEARPARALTGMPIALQTSVDGHCFARPTPSQIVLLIDLSRSMDFRESLARSRESLTNLLGMLDRSDTELALVVFDEKARLLLPLGTDPARFGPALATLEAGGGTWAESGLEAATALLTGPGSRPEARRSVLLVTDGAFDHGPEAEAAAIELRATGAEIQVLAWVNEAFTPSRQLLTLERVAGDEDRVWFAPQRPQLAALAAALSSDPEPTWLETVTLEIPLPPDLRYLPGSAVPEASYDRARHRLVWTRGPVAAGEDLRLRFELSAAQPTTWPGDLAAMLQYRESAGRAGSLSIPAPVLEVVAPLGRLLLPWTGR